MKINILNQKVLYTGYDREKNLKIKNILNKHNINFIEKEWSTRHSQAHGRGNFGELHNYQIMYKIYVHYKDYEEAIYLINL